MNDEEIVDEKAFSQKDITPKDLLRFANRILLTIAGVFVMGGVSYIVWPVSGAVIFEACKTILPSFATFIIGYYFGKS